jgi:hypothetical protein
MFILLKRNSFNLNGMNTSPNNFDTIEKNIFEDG